MTTKVSCLFSRFRTSTKKETGNHWSQIIVCSTPDLRNHVFWNVDSIISKIQELGIQVGDSIELTVDIDSSFGRAIIIN